MNARAIYKRIRLQNEPTGNGGYRAYIKLRIPLEAFESFPQVDNVFPPAELYCSGSANVYQDEDGLQYEVQYLNPKYIPDGMREKYTLIEVEDPSAHGSRRGNKVFAYGRKVKFDDEYNTLLDEDMPQLVLGDAARTRWEWDTFYFGKPNGQRDAQLLSYMGGLSKAYYLKYSGNYLYITWSVKYFNADKARDAARRLSLIIKHFAAKGFKTKLGKR